MAPLPMNHVVSVVEVSKKTTSWYVQTLSVQEKQSIELPPRVVHVMITSGRLTSTLANAAWTVLTPLYASSKECVQSRRAAFAAVVSTRRPQRHQQPQCIHTSAQVQFRAVLMDALLLILTPSQDPSTAEQRGH